MPSSSSYYPYVLPIITNLSCVPAVVWAWKSRDTRLFSVWFALISLISAAYHTCQLVQDELFHPECSTIRLFDVTGGCISFIIIVLYIVKIPFRIVIRYKIIMICIMCVVFYNFGIHVEWAVFFTTILYFIIVYEGLYLRWDVVNEIDWSFVKSGVAFTIAGLTLLFTPESFPQEDGTPLLYWFFHSIWHVLATIGLLHLVKCRPREVDKEYKILSSTL